MQGFFYSISTSEKSNFFFKAFRPSELNVSEHDTRQRQAMASDTINFS